MEPVRGPLIPGFTAVKEAARAAGAAQLSAPALLSAPCQAVLVTSVAGDCEAARPDLHCRLDESEQGAHALPPSMALPLPPPSSASHPCPAPPCRRLWLHHQRRGPHRRGHCLRPGGEGGHQGCNRLLLALQAGYTLTACCLQPPCCHAPALHASLAWRPPDPSPHLSLPLLHAGGRAREGGNGGRLPQRGPAGGQLSQGGAPGQRGRQARVGGPDISAATRAGNPGLEAGCCSHVAQSHLPDLTPVLFAMYCCCALAASCAAALPLLCSAAAVINPPILSCRNASGRSPWSINSSSE